MGTSNWQNIPYTIEALMKVEPKRVLDVGIGYGRWGMAVREFCELWFGRIPRSTWNIWIEGVEAYEPNIDEYHKYFYNKIHIGDFSQIHRTLTGRWDVILFGDVLEHFTKDDACKLLEWSIDNSDYVLINIPLGTEWPQEDIYENTFERHLSEWTPEDFEAFHRVRYGLFNDYLGRPFGSFILSRKDPKGLRSGLFSIETKLGGEAVGAAKTRAEQLELENRYLLDEVKRLRVPWIRASRLFESTAVGRRVIGGLSSVKKKLIG